MAIGLECRCAVRRHVEASGAWGDDNTGAASMTNLAPMLSEGIQWSPDFNRDEPLVNRASQTDPTVVAWKGAGTLPCELQYQGLEYLLLSAMGFESPTVYSGVYGSGSGGSPAGNDASPEWYYHLFELDDVLHRAAWQSGERASSSGSEPAPTVWTAADRKVRALLVAEYGKEGQAATYPLLYNNCVVNRMVLRAGLSKCQIDFDLLARRLYNNVACNHANWALRPNAVQAHLVEATLLMDPVASSISKAWLFNDLELTLDNGLDQLWAAGDSAALYMREPNRAAVRQVSGRFKLPRTRYDASDVTSVWSYYDGATDLQLHLRFEGDLLAGTSDRLRFEVVLPRVRITKVDSPVQGSGAVDTQVEFVALKPSAIQTWHTTLRGGMGSYAKNNEMDILLRNTQACCYSRDRQATGVSLP